MFQPLSHQLSFTYYIVLNKSSQSKNRRSFFITSYTNVGGKKMFNFTDNFFDKVQKKTNVGKDTILNLASKLQQSDIKNENTLREIIQELGKMTGKEVPKEKQDKIIKAVVDDKVPKDINKFF